MGRQRGRGLVDTLGQGRLVSGRRLLPLILLLVGLSTIFFFGRIKGTLNGDYFISHQHLALAVNLSPSHHFLGFLNQLYDVSGDVAYKPYNRFPPGGYMLMKLITLVVGDGLSIRVAGVQMLMVTFFAGTAVLAYWSLCRLISNRWIASTAVLLGFSSSTVLIFSTATMPEIMPDLFGVSLTFHGMVIFVQDGRLRQLVVKACLALLLGWHVLALLLPFVLLGLTKEIIQAWKAKTIQGFSLSLYLSRAVTSRYFILGFVALGFGILILTYNIANEYYALNFRAGNQLALSDMPSIDSALRRTGTGIGNPDEIGRWLRSEYKVQWHIFLYSQLERLSYLAIPFALPFDSWSSLDRTVLVKTIPWAASAGISMIGVCVIGAVHLRRHRLLVLTAVLSGFCWSIPMRYNTGPHFFESLYYIGVILVFYTLILSLLYKWSGKGKKLLPLSAVGAFVLFVTSSYKVAYAEVERSNDEAFIDIESLIVDDVETIRQLTDGKNILVYTRPDIPIYDPHGWDWYPYIWPYGGLFYYLHGSGLIFDSRDCRISSYRVDFILQPKQNDAQGLLTPDNRVMYLYDRYVYEERIDKITEKIRPEVRGSFDVYLTDDRKLLYVGNRCTVNPLLLSNRVHLMVYPVDANVLSDSSHDYELHSFTMHERLIMDVERYVMIFDLPDYNIASISTGQSSSEGSIWGGRFFGPDHVVNAELHRRADQVISLSRIAAVRGYFDVYLTSDRTLMYVREQCHNGDISDDFFVHIFPVDRMDLPEHSRQSGFHNFDFAFTEHGSIDGQRCAGEIELPDYDIASISTGQFTNQGQTWRSELNATGD